MKSFEIKESNKMLPLIFQWFTDNQRALPWRINYAPYEVWISEMMLQQTQMERGVEYYLRWMKQFSSIEDVAHASESDILQAWEGLGYYSRARNLHATAKIICEHHSGKIPCDADTLLTFPGIGDYTVAAIMGISFEKDFPTIDANVERVFSRLCDIESNKLKAIVTEEVTKIFQKGKARIFNQAWMEFGALICKKTPQCQLCPITGFCESYRLGVQNLRPVAKKKTDIVPVYATFCAIYHPEKGYLLHKRPDKGLWANMWEFIGVDSFMLDNEQSENKINQVGETTQINPIEKLEEDNKTPSNNVLLQNTLCEMQTTLKKTIRPTKAKINHPMKNDLFYDLANLVLVKELKNIFNDDSIVDKTASEYILNISNARTNNQKKVKKENTQNENTSNSFPHAPFAHIKHSYTHHRLQALFYKWDIDFDLVPREDYKWVKDIKSVAMPAHHRKATSKL